MEVEEYNRMVEEYFRGHPEILELSRKLRDFTGINEKDIMLINKLMRATGWDKWDIINDVKHIMEDPSDHVIRYERLYNKYYNKAMKTVTRHARIKNMWAAILAYIKLDGALRGVRIPHWDPAMVATYVYNIMVEEEEKELKEIYEVMRTAYSLL